MTLYEAQKALRMALLEATKTAWGIAPKIGSVAPPSDEPKPQAYILLSSAQPSDDEADNGSFCEETVSVAIEIVLRECPPRAGQPQLNLLQRAQQLRDALGLRRAFTVWQGHPTTWLGETYRDEDLSEEETPDFDTLRFRMSVVLECQIAEATP